MFQTDFLVQKLHPITRALCCAASILRFFRSVEAIKRNARPTAFEHYTIEAKLLWYNSRMCVRPKGESRTRIRISHRMAACGHYTMLPPHTTTAVAVLLCQPDDARAAFPARREKHSPFSSSTLKYRAALIYRLQAYLQPRGTANRKNPSSFFRVRAQAEPRVRCKTGRIAF